MRTPSSLRKLDDRVLNRGRHRGGDDPSHDEPDTPPSSAPAADDRGGHHHARGDATRPQRPRRPAGDAVREVLGVVWRVARYVFLALALVVFLGIVLTFAPTNDDNTIVSTLLSWADWAAGPFRDVFTADDEDRRLLYNYGLATVVYLVAASLVGKLPGKRGVAR